MHSTGVDRYVLKEPCFEEDDYDYHVKVYEHLKDSRFVRHLHDTDPKKEWYAFKWYPDQLLNVISERPGALSLTTKRAISRDILRGIAELHEKHIVHTGSDATSMLQTMCSGADK